MKACHDHVMNLDKMPQPNLHVYLFLRIFVTSLDGVSIILRFLPVDFWGNGALQLPPQNSWKVNIDT